MGEPGNEIKAAARDVLRVGTRWAHAARDWFDERRNEMNNRYRDDRDEDERPARAERNGADQLEQEEERIAFDVLPPAIGPMDQGDAPEVEAEEAPRPRRRTVRKPKAGDDEVAPAA